MLEHIRIVLIHTSHPGNIGATARAMHTMGLQSLYLVHPTQFPHPKAMDMAAGATALLSQAHIVHSIEEAISDCHWVIATSTRPRTLSWPIMTPRQFAQQIQQQFCSQQTPPTTAILFGPEQSGLPNAILQKCHTCICIPTHPTYRSLNLAAAVQIISYELHFAALAIAPAIIHEATHEPVHLIHPAATAQEMERFFNHLTEIAINVRFLNLKAPRKLLARLRRFFLRARPEKMEINMLRGLLTAIQKYSAPHTNPDQLKK